jgi:hypothetical protein
MEIKNLPSITTPVANVEAQSINVQVLRQQLDRLGQVKNVQISNLKQDLMQDFTSVSHHIFEMAGTDGYNLLFHEIQQRFANTSSNAAPIRPGTVEGYFMGCFVPSNFKYGDNCSLSCLTGAPGFHDSGIPTCKRNVYLAPFDGKYNFTKINQGVENIDSALIYYKPPFEGFTPDEIHKLQSEGIDQVILSYFDNSKSDYHISEPARIQTLESKHLGPKRTSYRSVSSDSDSSSECNLRYWMIVFILLILSILALYFGKRN